MNKTFADSGENGAGMTLLREANERFAPGARAGILDRITE